MNNYDSIQSRSPSSCSRRQRLGTALITLIGLGLAAQTAAVSPAAADWSATLNGGPAHRLVGTTATLTATFSTDVGPTPYYHLIYNRGTQQLVKACGAGTTCSATVSYTAPTTQTYVAVRARWSSTYPPSDVQETTNQVTISWRQLVLATSRTSQQVRQFITLTAQSATDVGPTPYYIQIFDKMTNQRTWVCSSGTTCEVTLTENEWWRGTHEYVAFVSSWSTTYPPPNIQATSNSVYVTWT